MKKFYIILAAFLLMSTVYFSKDESALYAQSKAQSKNLNTKQTNSTNSNCKKDMKLNIKIDNYTFTATLEKNKSTEELLKILKKGDLKISMSDYSGFEKVGSLGRNLPSEDEYMSVDEGDIMLYNSNNLVIFYGKHSYSYTKIGKIDDTTDLKNALKSKNITAVLSYKDEK